VTVAFEIGSPLPVTRPETCALQGAPPATMSQAMARSGVCTVNRMKTSVAGVVNSRKVTAPQEAAAPA